MVKQLEASTARKIALECEDKFKAEMAKVYEVIEKMAKEGHFFITFPIVPEQRMGPLKMETRLSALDHVLQIQNEINEQAKLLNRPFIDILNKEEENRIRELISLNTWPDGWTGDEPGAEKILDKFYSDGSVMPALFSDDDF